MRLLNTVIVIRKVHLTVSVVVWYFVWFKGLELACYPLTKHKTN